MCDGAIIQAAIVAKDGTLWTLPRPFRHHDIVQEISKAQIYGGMRPHVTHETQGFITSEWRFVGRETAFTIAQAADQILAPRRGVAELFSEDVW